MSKQLINELSINTSNIANDLAINASDVLIPFEDIVNETKNGWIRVSENDTTVKHLFDAFIENPIGVISQINNPGADEQIEFSIDDSIVVTSDNVLTLSNKALAIPEIDDFSSAQHNHSDENNGNKITKDAIKSEFAGEGYILTANGTGAATWAVPPNSISKTIDLIATAGEALNRNDMVYLDSASGTWFKIDIDSVDNIKLSFLRGCVTQNGGIAQGATGTVRIFGEVDLFSGLSPWQKIYAGNTAGLYLQTKPQASNYATQVAIAEMGYAISTTKVFMNVKPVVYVKREIVPSNSVVVIQHHEDKTTQTRKPKAFIVDSTSQYSEPCIIGRWNNGNTDVAVRFDDNTGNNSETATTFMNISNESLDLVFEVTVI